MRAHSMLEERFARPPKIKSNCGFAKIIEKSDCSVLGPRKRIWCDRLAEAGRLLANCKRKNVATYITGIKKRLRNSLAKRFERAPGSKLRTLAPCPIMKANYKVSKQANSGGVESLIYHSVFKLMWDGV